ncbi:hypothetical protein [Shewanella sp. UCD-FRSSP16_17]|uniref:hypothetical protein n=1 Tax=Shewanella sp. UCD-FRSSP16_17 TaxID=1853256 RepID=UPI0012E880A0|nr:hypothetical protein [Shewanella sp. UCD-FRSSP16_17]
MKNKPIVLLIHGMGTHPTGNITKEFKKGLSESASYLELTGFEPDKEFEFQEFNYSEYFDKKRLEISDEAEFLTEYMAAGPYFLQRLISFQSKIKDDKSLYTHWLDVIFYCLLGTLRETILARCMEKILSVLKEAKDHPDSYKEVIIVGHSLGTSVLHDSLTKLYLRPSEPDRADHIRFSNYPIDGLWTIANVSRLTYLLTRLEDPNTSIVRDHNNLHDGVSHFFYPVYNQYDPFTIFNRYSVDPQVGDLIRTNEIRKIDDSELSVNPHDLVEYMADPEVGGVFLSEFSSFNIGMNQIQKAKTAYRKTTISGPISDQYSTIKKALKELEVQTNQGASTKRLVTLTIEIFELIKEAYDLMKNLKAKG